MTVHAPDFHDRDQGLLAVTQIIAVFFLFWESCRTHKYIAWRNTILQDIMRIGAMV
jgi:hypothetical protein